MWSTEYLLSGIYFMPKSVFYLVVIFRALIHKKMCELYSLISLRVLAEIRLLPLSIRILQSGSEY